MPPFDETAARAYGDVVGIRKEMGRPMNVPDGQIAGIARSRALCLCTPNTRDFTGCGIEVMNPFGRA